MPLGNLISCTDPAGSSQSGSVTYTGAEVTMQPIAMPHRGIITSYIPTPAQGKCIQRESLSLSLSLSHSL